MNNIYLLVTIDTEEDGWGIADFSCSPEENMCPVENVYSIPRVQEIFDEFGIRPIYLCNSPVLDDQRAVELLTGLHRQNRCDIGAHIHPWNTSPVDEEINDFNSHIKNLGPPLIKKKLTNITNTIIQSFAIHPRIFRAGRWGMDDEVIKVLIELGYTIDSSVTPYTGWKEYGEGADFTGFPDRPYYIDLSRGISVPAHKPGNILEIPVSIGFNRTNFELCHSIHSFLKRYPIKRSGLLGILRRTGIMQKIWLSPELNNIREMIAFSETLLRKGTNLFHFTFHSTSLLPGKSPFVNSESDLEQFLDTIRLFFSWLTSRGNVVSVASTELIDLIDRGLIQSCLPEKEQNQEK